MNEEGFYRLMHRVHAPKQIGGSFQFGSFARYRQLEAEGDAHIGDAEEGLTHFDITDYFEAGSVEPRKRARLKSLGFDIRSTAGHISINRCRSTHTADAYVFSFSYGKPRELLKHFAKQNSRPDPYDCAVKLPDPEWLADFISRTGRLLTGEAIAHRMKSISWGKVQYGENNFHYMADVPLADVVMRKRPRYADDNEYRIVLVPHRNEIQDNLYVTTNPPFGCMSIWEG
ncbi:hypothetical protein [Tardibacter chloracetimidivorans]|nr:hypothetical protein [Tardibacter chloracetimidivorans]